MARLILTLLLLTTSAGIFGQAGDFFAPVGAQWRYDFYSWGNPTGVVVQHVKSDTVINGMPARKLVQERYSFFTGSLVNVDSFYIGMHQQYLLLERKSGVYGIFFDNSWMPGDTIQFVGNHWSCPDTLGYQFLSDTGRHYVGNHSFPYKKIDYISSMLGHFTLIPNYYAKIGNYRGVVPTPLGCASDLPELRLVCYRDSTHEGLFMKWTELIDSIGVCDPYFGLVNVPTITNPRNVHVHYSNSSFHISGEVMPGSGLVVYDYMGRVIRRLPVDAPGTYPMHGIQSGLYLFDLRSGNKRLAVGKFIVHPY